MTNAGSVRYHPVSLNREYLAGKMLEEYARKHAKAWNDFSMERRVRVREEFLDAIRVLEESLATASPAFLIDHACRQQFRFEAGRFPKDFAITFLSAFNAVLLQELPEDYRKQAGVFGKKTAAALKSASDGSGISPEAETPLSPKARSFLKAVLAGDAGKSRVVIDEALAAGTHLREIYTGIFQPALRETGRLWQQDEATIAQEHYVTGIVRGIMEQLHDRIAQASGRSQKKRVVTACVGEELHEIGIRMVADFFVMDGWDVYSTGANTPAKSILAAVKEQKADVVALSITMPSRLAELEYLVRSLRADKATADVKVIVGGYPFILLPGLAKQIGADAVAAGAEDAVAAANRLGGKTTKKSTTRTVKKK
jgi:MerR family transcriptional regulator, light-induced transcriptional regulator